MKKTLLFAILALSLNGFAQTNPALSLPKDLRANSIHNTVREKGKLNQTTEIFSPTSSRKGIHQSSREVFGLEQRIDSVYLWGWDTLGYKLALQSRAIDFLYNAANYPTSFIYQNWNGSSWDNYIQSITTYDANNNETSSVLKIWTGFSWMNAIQSVYTYDANNNQTSELSQYWTGFSWLNASYYIYTYDGNHNLLTETDQSWDGTAWLNFSRYTYTYSNNNQISDLHQTWDDVNAVWVNSDQYLYAYDGNHNLTSSTFQFWTGISWENISLTSYTYDGNNNQTSELDQYWDGTGWVNDAKYTNTYNASNNLTYTLLQSWNGAGWDNAGRINNTYNASHLLIKSLTELWNGTTWKYSDVSFYSYGENDFLAGQGSRTYDGVDNLITTGDSTHFYFKTVVGTKDLASEDGTLTVYPNPSNGKFTISSQGTLGEIEIFNSLGERIYSAKKVNGQTSSDINITGFASGVYQIVIKEGTQLTNRKMLIQ